MSSPAEEKNEHMRYVRDETATHYICMGSLDFHELLQFTILQGSSFPRNIVLFFGRGVV